VLTALGERLPERVLRDFSRHRDARSLDRYSKPRATRGLLVSALPRPAGPGPSPVHPPEKAEPAKPNTADNSGE
jgi:hypothetical protein